jgi:hypothetical protein
MLTVGLGRGISLTTLAALFLLFSPILNYSVAFAQFPIAQPGTEGFEVIVSSTSPVIATYQGNSALFSNDLYLVVDGNPAHDIFLFNNHESQVGSTRNLGSFPVGTKLVFRLHVRDTGQDYFTGAGSRNPDGHAHARAQADWMPNETLVSFEDLFNGPFDYNDLSFSFIPTTATVQFPLTVTKAGTGSGTVTSSPAGISCGSTCSASFSQGTSVALSATAASGSTFAGWSGEGCSGTCTVSMTQARSVTATFQAIAQIPSIGWYSNNGPVTIYEGPPK